MTPCGRCVFYIPNPYDRRGVGACRHPYEPWCRQQPLSAPSPNRDVLCRYFELAPREVAPCSSG